MLLPAEIEALLAQVDAGQRDAFRGIIHAYGLPLRSFIASQVHHRDDADDLAQEVFLTAFRRRDTFRRGDDFGAWLRGIARNKLSDYFRSSPRRNQALSRFREEVARVVQADLEQGTASDDAVAIEALLRCISRLPEKLRRVVRAGLSGGKPASLAREFATTVGAIYNLHYRANLLLRECVQGEVH